MEIKKIYSLKHTPMIYSSLKMAQGAQSHCIKPAHILRDGARFFLVCPADGAKLNRAGFDYVK